MTDFCGKRVDVHPNGAAYNVSYAASGLLSTMTADTHRTLSFPLSSGNDLGNNLEKK